MTKIPLLQAPEEEKKRINNSSFNKANLSLNRNLFKKNDLFHPPNIHTPHHIPPKIILQLDHWVYIYLLSFTKFTCTIQKKHVFTFFSYLATFFEKCRLLRVVLEIFWGRGSAHQRQELVKRARKHYWWQGSFSRTIANCSQMKYCQAICQ